VAESCWEPCVCTGTSSPSQAGIYAVSSATLLLCDSISLGPARWHSDIPQSGSVTLPYPSIFVFSLVPHRVL